MTKKHACSKYHDDCGWAILGQIVGGVVVVAAAVCVVLAIAGGVKYLLSDSPKPEVRTEDHFYQRTCEKDKHRTTCGNWSEASPWVTTSN